MSAIIQRREQSVRKANALIQKSRHKLSLPEQKVLLYICSMIKPTDTELKYEFSLTDYINVCGMADGGRAYQDLKKILKKLRDTSWEVKTDDGRWKLVAWLRGAEGSEAKGIFNIELDPYLKPFLLNVSERFTDYKLIYVLGLSSKYAIHLYEICKSFAWVGGCAFSVDEFKSLFMLNETKSYERWNIVKQKVIDVALKQINEFTDLNVEYKDNGGRGKMATQVGFKVTNKETNEAENVKKTVHEMLDTYNVLPDEKIETSIREWLNTDKPIPVRKKKEQPQPEVTDEIMPGQYALDDYLGELEQPKSSALAEYKAYTDLIRDNLEYEILKDRYPHDRDRIDEIISVMVDTLLSTKKTIRVDSEEKPASIVKSRFLKINFQHMEYIFESLERTTSDIRNIKSYLITVIYQASMTIGSYYDARVKHDLYGYKDE